MNNFKIRNDFNSDSLKINNQISIPQSNISQSNVQLIGSIILDSNTKTLYVSNGETWQLIGNVIENLGSGISIGVPPFSLKSLHAGLNINLIDTGSSITINSISPNILSSSVNTTNAIPTQILEIDLLDKSSNMITLMISGIIQETNISFGYNINVVVKNISGIVTTLSSQTKILYADDPISTDIIFSTFGPNKFNISVIGINETIISWSISAMIRSVNY